MFKRHNPGCTTGGCSCGPVECLIATDGFDGGDTGSPLGWTEIDGDFDITSGKLVPDTSGTNQKISWDADTYAGAVGVQIKIKGQTGDRLGVGIYNDANNYSEFTVRFGSANGRTNYNTIVGGVTTFTYNQSLECLGLDLDIPPGEEATLTVIWTSGGHADSCFTALDGKADFNAILETSAGTYLMAVGVPDVPTGASIILLTGTDSIVATFDDFVLFNPVNPCDTVQSCCIAPAIAVEEGWTEASAGQFDLFPAGTPPYVTSDTMGAVRLVDEEYWNDNLALSLKVGFTVSSIAIGDWSTYGGRWRMFFSYTVGNRFFVEMAMGEIEPDYLLYEFKYRLWHDTTLLAWMDIWASQGGLGSGTFDAEDFFATLGVTVWDCQIYWGFVWTANLGVFGLSIDGGIVGGAEFSVGNARGVSFCAGDAFSLNHSGKIGIGVGNDSPEDPIAFAELSAACSEEFTCEGTADEDPPDDDPEDPGDPTGCCTGTGWEDLEVGDAVEVTISGVVYFLGPPCPDASCDLTSAFLTALNATHSCNVIGKSVDGLVIFRRLTLTNPCDVCFSVDGAPLTIEIMVKVFINEDDDCQMMGRVGSNCGGCDMNYISTAFSVGADCEALTLDYVDPGFPRPEFNCCINGIGSALTLAIP